MNDLVLLHAIDSVQGYGSAVPAAYDAATGTHDVENLLPSALLGPTFDDLDLGLVVVVPEQFGTILNAGGPHRSRPGPARHWGECGGPAARWRGSSPVPAGRPVAPGAGMNWQLPAPTRSPR